MTTILCTHCKKSFAPLETPSADFVKRSAKNEASEIGIECPHCEEYTKLKPVAFMNGEPCQVAFEPYRCPVSACCGHVSFIEESDDESEFWGCGECGSIWYDKENLIAEIDAIVIKFKYRKKCYRRKGKSWVPAPIEREPEDYEDMVMDEPDDENDSYERG